MEGRRKKDSNKERKGKIINQGRKERWKEGRKEELNKERMKDRRKERKERKQRGRKLKLTSHK